MKILIAVPTFESIYPDTFKAIYGLARGEHELAFNFIRGYDCATARNRIAQSALDEGALQIHGGGMGCALIKADLFNQFEYPWYDWVNYKDDNRGMLSEDLYFCEQCKKHGVKIYTDTRVGCGHMLLRRLKEGCFAKWSKEATL